MVAIRQMELLQARALRLRIIRNNIRARDSRVIELLLDVPDIILGAVRVIDTDLLDLVREIQQANADGYERDSDHEEGRQDRARGEDRLPGG